MLIFYDNKVLSNVSIKEFRVLDKDNHLSCRVSLFYRGWQLIRKRKEKVPFVQVPKLEEGKWQKCKIGTLDLSNMNLIYKEIELNRVSIISIEIMKHNRDSFELKKAYYTQQFREGVIEFFYKIELGFAQFVNEGYSKNYGTHVFYSYEFKPKHEDNYTSASMEFLFSKFIPFVHDYLFFHFNRIPIKLINFNFIDLEWPRENSYIAPKLFSASTLNDLLMTLKIRNRGGKDVISIGSGKEHLLNYFLAEIYYRLTNARLLYDDKYKDAFSEIPECVRNMDKESACTYLKCLIQTNFVTIFNDPFLKETAEEYTYVKVPSDITEYEFGKSNSYHFIFSKVEPSKEIVYLYDFIVSLKTIHEQHGQYRAGRDDYEYKIKSFDFETKGPIEISNNAINKINNILGIQLKHNKLEERNIHHYGYHLTYDDGYIGGLAESRDLGSESLRIESINKLTTYFVNNYVDDPNDFERFI